MLEAVKRALHLTTDEDNERLNDLIQSAMIDLGIAGVEYADDQDAIIRQAVCLYCTAYYYLDTNFERLMTAYDMLKSQLGMTTGYTDWGDADAQT